MSKEDLFTRLIKTCTGLDAIKEHRFHPLRKWRFDYCILSHKIALEVEGGAWTNGRHTRGKGFIADMQKYNEAVRLGYKLIRVVPDLLHTDYTIKLIEDLAGVQREKDTKGINLN